MIRQKTNIWLRRTGAIRIY